MGRFVRGVINSRIALDCRMSQAPLLGTGLFLIDIVNNHLVPALAIFHKAINNFYRPLGGSRRSAH